MTIARCFRGAVAALAVAGVMFAAGLAQAQVKVHVALGEPPSVESLAFLIALERAKERGIDFEITSFAKEELAVQSIVNGQANIGVGGPYAVIQRTKVPLKVVFQMSRLVFFPVVSKEYATWQDLDGQPFTFHGRGSGTEAIGNILAKRNGIEFGERSYVPGSENRIIAMINGQIKATIVDLASKNLLLEKGGDDFHVLPGIDNPASDELVFASTEWMENNQEHVDIIVEELLRLWREMADNPNVIEEERAARNLLSDQPREVIDEVVPFYVEAIKEGVFHPSGGGAEAAMADFEFYTEAGQLEGSPGDIKVEDFWDLGPLERAREKLGG
jgi:NitT/TauT family transport system substrate-binding protein